MENSPEIVSFDFDCMYVCMVWGFGEQELDCTVTPSGTADLSSIHGK